MPVLLVLIVALCAAAAAQTAEKSPWADLASAHPPGLDLTLRIIEPHVYQRGEVIRAEVTSATSSAKPDQALPKERWSFSGILLEPAVGCGSVQGPCWGRLASGTNGIDPHLSIGERPAPMEFVLNAYLPTLPPGGYRAALLAKKLVLGERSGIRATYRYAEPPQYAVSNAVGFEVKPPSAEWVTQTIADSLGVLNGPVGEQHQAYEARQLAARRLRFLDEPAAWQASLEALPAEESVLLRGLEESSEPRRVCALTRSRIPLPDQAVSFSYLSLLARICGRKALLNAERDRMMRPLAAALAASLPAKLPRVKAETFAALFRYIRQMRFGDEPESSPPWTPTVRREFVRGFAGLEAQRRTELLELAALSVESPELLPLFESVLDAWKPGDYSEAPREALVGLHGLDPTRARARILAELTKRETWIDVPQLDLLPASAAPPMDGDLVEVLERELRDGEWSPPWRMAAVSKYAGPGVLPRVRSIYEALKEPCQPELMAYFVRVDPAYAGRVFQYLPWDMLAPAPPCAVRYFEVTPRLAMAPVLEDYLVAYLMHHQVPVKQAAARSLGRYGSPAALKPLWDAFRYFHEYWKGKGEELVRNEEGIPLEAELRNAIARGTNWLASDADLRLIESLCISGRCLGETREDLAWWREPLRIELRDEPGGVEGGVAQYFRLPTLEAVKTKLVQFPRGSRFILTARGPRSRQAAAEIRELAARRGLVVAEAR